MTGSFEVGCRSANIIIMNHCLLLLCSMYCDLLGDDEKDDSDLQEAIKQSLKHYQEETQRRHASFHHSLKIHELKP